VARPGVRIVVRDEGVGIPDDKLSMVFEPFYSTKLDQGGSGLGLSTVHGFVHQYGGEIDIESTEGVGTTISLWFPEGDTDRAHRSPLVTDGQTWEVLAGSRVLYVEDDQGLRSIVKLHMETAGVEVVAFSLAADALDYVEEGNPFGLLVTDVAMPSGISGLDLAAAVRGLLPECPILVTTAYVAQFDPALVPAEAIVLEKPVSRSDLLDALAALRS